MHNLQGFKASLVDDPKPTQRLGHVHVHNQYAYTVQNFRVWLEFISSCEV